LPKKENKISITKGGNSRDKGDFKKGFFIVSYINAAKMDFRN